MRWLTVTHTQRWHAAHRTSGTGALYQGRFKSFPIQEDDHLLTVLRYVERNPLRANLVQEAAAWRWSSLWHRVHGGDSGLVDDGPLTMPLDWLTTCSALKAKASWRRCDDRWCAARRLARPLGRNERPSDSACSPRFALAVVNRKHQMQRPGRHPRRTKTPDPFESSTGYGSDSGSSNFCKTYDALSGSYTEYVEAQNHGDGTTPYYMASGTAGEKGYVDRGSSSYSAKLTLLFGYWVASGSGTDDRTQTFNTYYSGKGSGPRAGSDDTTWSTKDSDSGTSQSVTKQHAALTPTASSGGSVVWSEGTLVNSSDVTADNRFSDDYTWGGGDRNNINSGQSHTDQYLHQETVDGSPLASAYYGNGHKYGWQHGSGGSRLSLQRRLLVDAAGTVQHGERLLGQRNPKRFLRPNAGFVARFWERYRAVERCPAGAAGDACAVVGGVERAAAAAPLVAAQQPPQLLVPGREQLLVLLQQPVEDGQYFLRVEHSRLERGGRRGGRPGGHRRRHRRGGGHGGDRGRLWRVDICGRHDRQQRRGHGRRQDRFFRRADIRDDRRNRRRHFRCDCKALASEIKAAQPPYAQGRTVAVAVLNNGERVVANSTKPLLEEEAIDKAAELGIKDIGGVGSLHAEEKIIAYAENKGVRIVEIGPTTPICGPESHNCLAQLIAHMFG